MNDRASFPAADHVLQFSIGCLTLVESTRSQLSSLPFHRSTLPPPPGSAERTAGRAHACPAEMALQAQQLSSFPFASPAFRSPLLRCSNLQSSTKCFLRSHSQLQTTRRPNHRVAAYSPHRFLDHHAREGSRDDGDEPDGRWDPPASFSRARLHGAREDKEDGWWGPPHGGEGTVPQKRLQEYEGEAAGDVGEWDPPVSPFRGHLEEPYHQEEEDEDGEEREWLNPSFFLRSQKGVSGICTTAAMEEILAFSRSPPGVDGPEFAKFLAGYSLEDLSEGDCVELMRSMVEEEMVLSCVHLFQWMSEQERLPVPPRALLVAVTALGQTGMVDEILEIIFNLPSELEFHETVLYNAAMSAVIYCRR